MRTNKTCAIIADIKKLDGLLPLSERRPVSLLPYDGIYRMIDFQLSNVIDAGIHSIFMVFNQGMTQSVIDHISSGKEWNLSSLPNRYFMHFYNGAAGAMDGRAHYYDALIEYIEKSDSEFTVFMGNKMLCNIDLGQIQNVHKIHPDDITVVYKKVTERMFTESDIALEISPTGKITGVNPFDKAKMTSETSNLFMNISVVKSEWLIKELINRKASGTEILAVEEILFQALKTKTAWAFEYTGYLSNIFDIKSYFEANMAMLESNHFLSLLHSSKKIYMKNINEVPTYYSKTSQVYKSQVATGGLVYGSLNNSILSPCVTIGEGVEVNHAIIMAKSTIKKDAVISYAILDKNVVVEEGVKIIGTPENPVVITKNAHVTKDVTWMEE